MLLLIKRGRRCRGHYKRKGEGFPALRSGDEAPFGEEGRGIGLEHKEGPRLLQGQEDQLLEAEEEVRRHRFLPGGQEPQAPLGAPEEGAQEDDLQDKMPPRPGEEEEAPPLRQRAFRARGRQGLKKAIAFFGYKPKEIQTDSGFELSGRARAKGGGFPAVCRDGPNFLERFCLESGMAHKLIRPRTPERNGKVERSHRIDQERFCRTLRFYSLADLASQGARWNGKYNDMPRMALKPRPPNQVEIGKLRKLMQDTGEARCPRLLKRFTSIEN